MNISSSHNALRKQIFLGLLIAIATGIGFIENMMPLPIAMPGARLGLSNVVIVTTMVVFGRRDAIAVALTKSLVLMLVTGAVTSFFYSFAGALLSSVVMALAFERLPRVSLIGISLLGSAFHNVGQVATAMFMVHNVGLINYLPALLLLGIFTGIFVGHTANILSRHLLSLHIVR
ncbi:MAG: Gx transporter family protein [Tissierellia bacterium]|nr:Gx transporter family protein [Tissierellia bacterium]